MLPRPLGGCRRPLHGTTRRPRRPRRLSGVYLIITNIALPLHYSSRPPTVVETPLPVLSPKAQEVLSQPTMAATGTPALLSGRSCFLCIGLWVQAASSARRDHCIGLKLRLMEDPTTATATKARKVRHPCFTAALDHGSTLPSSPCALLDERPCCSYIPSIASFDAVRCGAVPCTAVV